MRATLRLRVRRHVDIQLSTLYKTAQQLENRDLQRWSAAKRGANDKFRDSWKPLDVERTPPTEVYWMMVGTYRPDLVSDGSAELALAVQGAVAARRMRAALEICRSVCGSWRWSFVAAPSLAWPRLVRLYAPIIAAGDRAGDGCSTCLEMTHLIRELCVHIEMTQLISELCVHICIARKQSLCDKKHVARSNAADYATRAARSLRILMRALALDHAPGQLWCDTFDRALSVRPRVVHPLATQLRSRMRVPPRECQCGL